MVAKFIRASDPAAGIKEMADEISAVLKDGWPVLWLVCGGSNIPSAVTAMKKVRAKVSGDELAHLKVALTDERYGPVGHPDSNWRQLADAGFIFDGARPIPVLKGKDMEQTVADYASEIEDAASQVIRSKGKVVGLFGIGGDGHIAGILPHSPAVSAQAAVAGYDAGPYRRITLTPAFLCRVSSAYAFAFGAAKKEAMLKLRDETFGIDEQPAQLLKSLAKEIAYSDQY